MKRHLFGTVLLVLLVAMAGCLGAVQAPAQQLQTDSPDESTVSISATGSVMADPDLAVVFVAVEATADTADAAREQVVADATSMREAIRVLGIPDDQVQTVGFSIRPEYDFSGDQRALLGYTATHAFEIEAGVDQAGTVIDAAVGNGASRVDGVQFTLADETRRDLRAQALEEAMANARADADTVAAAADVSVTGVESISTGDVGFPVFRSVAESGAGGDTVIEPGPVTVMASVSVTYTIG